jgi:hypothetical protein
MRSGFSAVAAHERYAGSRPRGSHQSGRTPIRPLPAFAFQEALSDWCIADYAHVLRTAMISRTKAATGVGLNDANAPADPRRSVRRRGPWAAEVVSRSP